MRRSLACRTGTDAVRSGEESRLYSRRPIPRSRQGTSSRSRSVGREGRATRSVAGSSRSLLVDLHLLRTGVAEWSTVDTGRGLRCSWSGFLRIPFRDRDDLGDYVNASRREVPQAFAAFEVAVRVSGPGVGTLTDLERGSDGRRPIDHEVESVQSAQIAVEIADIFGCHSRRSGFPCSIV